jgi:hypothetical protein
MTNNVKFFADSCGDLASMLLIKKEPWLSENLVKHSLFAQMKENFDRLDTDLVCNSPIYLVLQEIISKIERPNSKDFDCRALVALLHRNAVKFCESVLRRDLQVHFDLRKIWSDYGIE